MGGWERMLEETHSYWKHCKTGVEHFLNIIFTVSETLNVDYVFIRDAYKH